LTPDGSTGQGVSITVANPTSKVGQLNFAVDAGFEEWSFRKATVPVPATFLLFLTGLAALGFSRRKSVAV
jgi:hypothetical protein